MPSPDDARWSWTNALEPVTVVAIDTGTTTLIARIGSQQVTTKLRIVTRR